MTDDERRLLDTAMGTADAAWSMCSALVQLLGERGIIPPADLLTALDHLAYSVEEILGPDARAGHAAERLRLYSRLHANLAGLPAFRPHRGPAGGL